MPKLSMIRALLAVLAAGVVVVPASAASMGGTERKALIDKYCVSCHNERQKTGGLVLENMATDRLETQAGLWEKVVRKIRSGTMPPVRMPRPDAATLDALVASIETTLDTAAAAAPNPGRPAIHRLNRAEYVNAIRDLLALEIDGKALLPADDSGFGFDNISDVLTVSPGLFERYMSVARLVAKTAIGDSNVNQVIARVARMPLHLTQDDRRDETLPFGTRGGVSAKHMFPTDGRYTIRIELQRDTLFGNVRGRGEDNLVDLRIDGERVKTFLLPKAGPIAYGTADTSRPLEIALPVKAGQHTIAIAMVGATTMVEGYGPSRFPVGSTAFAQAERTSPSNGVIELGIDSVYVEGPFDPMAPDDTASRRAIFVCTPRGTADESVCASKILSRLAYRAYRRPVTAKDTQVLLGFYDQGRGEGSFDRGIQFALERILIAPDFLFRIEGARAKVAKGAVHQLDGYEIASRLSFFLWSSIPDDALLSAAAGGRLTDPVVIEREIRRMLADQRSNALLSNFFGQWLYTRNMTHVLPDATKYPEFDDNLREAFQRETDLFLASQVREDRSVFELLTADYTFVNERLARHYGIANVYGSRFRRVTLPDDTRAGLLGHGSVLTVTAYAHRTSPVLRGKWLMENILGTPPPPPPANVPPLDATKVEGTLRQRMEAHRRNPVCATCHNQIDPLGFALENFDGIGKYRTVDGTAPVDASGTLPDGTRFDSPASFRKLLMARRLAYASTLAEKLMTYALGRGLDYYDMPAVRKVLTDASASDYRWSALLTAIVRSAPFQTRRSES